MMKRPIAVLMSTIMVFSASFISVDAMEKKSGLIIPMSLDENISGSSLVNTYDIADADPSHDPVISNEYFGVIMNRNGFSIGTTGGDPNTITDDNSNMLFGYPSEVTSFATVRVDDNNHKFSADEESAAVTPNSIVSSDTYNGIFVTQHFNILRNQYTGREDILELYYTAKNIDTETHNVGIRIMLDTMLGGNDSAPFRIPSIGNVDYETDLTGNNIPEFWQAFDNLTNPNVVSQSTLKLDAESTPDRVRFTNWGKADDNFWDYTREAGTSNGDSAVCMYWNPRTLAPGEEFACKTYYGLSTLQQDNLPPLLAALSGVSRLDVIKDENGNESYTPNPFSIAAYVQNVGTETLHNAKIELVLPSGMTLMEGENEIVIGELPVSDTQTQFTWKVNAEGSAVDRNSLYSIKVSADGVNPKVLTREIEIPAISGGSFIETTTEETTEKEYTESTTERVKDKPNRGSGSGSSSNKADVRVSGEVVTKEQAEVEDYGKKVQYEDVYVYGALKDFPLIETYNIKDEASAVAAVKNMIELIDNAGGINVDDEDVSYELANFAEAAIGLSATASIKSSGELSSDVLNEISEKSKSTKAAVDKLLGEKNVELPRELLTGATLEANDVVNISKDVKTLPIDDIYVDMGESGYGVTLTKQFVEENASDEDLAISFASLTDDTEAEETEDTKETEEETQTDEEKTQADEEKEDINNEEVAAASAPAGKFSVSRQIKSPAIITLSLYPDADSKYQGVKGPDGMAVSKANNSKRNISARVTASGTYTVTKVASLDFTDINKLSTTQKDTLRSLYAHGLIEGQTKTTFAPSTTLTRAEFTTLLIKTMGAYDASYNGKSGFVDMKNSWAEPVVAKAKNLGIIAGYDSDNTFRPDNKLNNEQLYHMLGLAYTKNNPASAKLANKANDYVGKFSDNANISQWAKANIAVSVGTNIYSASQSGNFAPRNEVTRLDSAIAIGRLFDRAAFDGSWK